MTPITIALADDHRVVIRGVRTFLESFEDLQVVGIAPNGEELLARLREWKPRVVVVDLLMPGGIDGVEVTRRIKAASPATRVVALTASVDEARMMGVLRAGASGYVRKDSEPEVLLAAVRAVAAGKTYVDPSAGGAVLRSGAEEELTARERETLRRLAAGLSNKEIAEAMGIGEETVKTHVGNLLSKLQVQNRAQAIVQALKRGVVSLEELEG